MKLAFITPCCYPDHKAISLLLESARAFGWRVDPYGVGTPYRGWAPTKGPMLLDAIKAAKADGYSHILFSDGSDALVIGKQKEVVEKYTRLGSPPLLMSTERYCYPCEEFAPSFQRVTPFAYPNSGQWIGETDYMEDTLTRLLATYHDHCDQAWWVKEFALGGIPEAKLDRWCDIFQNMDAPEGELVVRKGRVLNRTTGTQPCFLHFSGGYSDSDVGRIPAMRPWWDRLKP